jgi:Alpha-L-arabinofuranosidase B (ABFB) domain
MTRVRRSGLAFLCLVSAVLVVLIFGTGVLRPEARAQDRPAGKKRDKVASIQSFNYPKTFIRHRDGRGFATEIESDLDRKDASWHLSEGLADRAHVSFRSVNYPRQYLRHQEGRLKLHDFEDAELFRNDATYKIVKGLADRDWVSFESQNYPGCYIRHKNGELWVEENDGTELFAKDATFRIGRPHYRP